MGYSSQQGWTSGYKSNSSSSSNKSSSNKSTTSTTQNRYTATSGSSSKNTVAVPSSSASYSTKSTGGSSSSSSNKSSSSSGSSSSLNRYNTTSTAAKQTDTHSTAKKTGTYSYGGTTYTTTPTSSSKSTSSSSSNRSSGSTTSAAQNRAVANGSTSTAKTTSSSNSAKTGTVSKVSNSSNKSTSSAAKITSATQNRAAATTSKAANSSNTTKNTSTTQNRYNAVKKAAVTSPTLSRYYATKYNNNDNNTNNILNNALKAVTGIASLKPLSSYTSNNNDNVLDKAIEYVKSGFTPIKAYAATTPTSSTTISNKVSESEFNRSTAMQNRYGTYTNYLNGITKPIVINSEPRSANSSNATETTVKILSNNPTGVSNKVSESEFNRSTAMQNRYGTYTNYLNGILNQSRTSNNNQGYNGLPWTKAGNAAPGSAGLVNNNVVNNSDNGDGNNVRYNNINPTNNTPINDSDLIYGDDGTNADLEEYLNGDGQITLDDVMALIEQYGPSGAYNSYPWMKSELQNYLNNAISTLNTQGTNFQNRLNDSFSNLLLNQQLSNMKNNASGFTSGEMSGAVLANNILGNQSLANSMNEASKEYWADLISQANTLAQQEANIPTDALSALNNTYTDNIANMLAEYLTGYNYGNVASKVNGIYNNWDSKRNYDVNLRALNKKS